MFSKTLMVEVRDYQGQLHRGFIGLPVFMISVQTDGPAQTPLNLVQLDIHVCYVTFSYRYSGALAYVNWKCRHHICYLIYVQKVHAVTTASQQLHSNVVVTRK